MKKYLLVSGSLLGLGAAAGLVYLAWQFWLTVIALDAPTLAAWAVLATLAIPIAGGFGLWLGRTEARATIGGLAAGIEHVTNAADKMISTRGNAIREMKTARGAPRPGGVSFNVFTPGAPGPAYFGGTGYPATPTIAPKALPPGEEVIDL